MLGTEYSVADYRYSCICSSTNNSNTICSNQNMSISVQNSSNCFSLASMSLVFRGVTTTSISSDSKLINTSKRKVPTSKSPNSGLHVWELSSNQLEIISFCKTLQILSLNQEEHLLRKSMMKNGLYTPVGVIKKVNLISAPLMFIADFLIYHIPFF